MPAKNYEIDGFRVGPFTEEESDILRRAIDDYVGYVPPEERNDVLRRLLSKHGRAMSPLVAIARAALPHRHPRSVYNFTRRRVVKYNSGKWSAVELHALLEHYFTKEAPSVVASGAEAEASIKVDEPDPSPVKRRRSDTSGEPSLNGGGGGDDNDGGGCYNDVAEKDVDVDVDMDTTNSVELSHTKQDKREQNSRHTWRAVSQRINRLPEQIHDKWKELRPCVEKFRHVFENPDWTEQQRINRISEMIDFKPQSGRSTKMMTKTTDSNGVMEAKEEEVPRRRRPLITNEIRREMHDFICASINHSEMVGPLASNIPWKKVSEHFKVFSESNLRLQWTLITYPRVLRRNVEGFSNNIVGRCGLHVLRKNRVRVDRLGIIDFSEWLPQFPPLYVTKCVEGFLRKALNRYRKGTLKHADVYVCRQGVLSSRECAKLSHPPAGSPLYVTSNGVYFDQAAKPEPRTVELASTKASKISKGTKNPDLRHRRPIHDLVEVDKGYVHMTLYRQIKLAYFEFQVWGHISSDIKVIARVPRTHIPPYK